MVFAREKNGDVGEYCRDPVVTFMAILSLSTWSVLLLRIVKQCAMSREVHLFLERRVRVYVDDITLLLRGVSIELPERTSDVCGLLKT